jgi:outer membrane protein OmpA-like peptidoglycan-associated protein
MRCRYCSADADALDADLEGVFDDDLDGALDEAIASVPRRRTAPIARSAVASIVRNAPRMAHRGRPVLSRFAYARADVLPQHLPTLRRVAADVVASARTAYPIHQVTLVGHTDATGAPAVNLALGQRRAEASRLVLARMMDSAVPGLSGRVRLLAGTAGASRPVTSNATEAGRALNRRVTVTPSGTPCRLPVSHPRSLRRWVALLRRAENLLVTCGMRSAEDRAHALTSIYYGSTWSLDFAVERSSVRNGLFEQFTARAFTAADDPRRCLRCGVFLSLQGTQDVAGIDMGHVLIGLDARFRSAATASNIFPFGVTGLEAVTWAGDLGGAAARLALDRITTAATPATTYFSASGTDYGASSNLEGDVGAYLVATPGSPLSPPTIGTGLIADAFADFFVRRAGWSMRCRSFLNQIGGITAPTRGGWALLNRPAVEASIASKLASFGSLYLVNWVRNHPPGGSVFSTLGTIGSGLSNIGTAADDVARVFVDKLVACRL